VALVDPLDINEADLQPEPATFGPLWEQYFSELDGLDTPDLQDPVLSTAPDLAAIALSMDAPINAATSSLAAELALAPDAELPKAEGNVKAIEDGFEQVRGAIPDEAFQAVPHDLLPPPELGGFTSSGTGGGGAPGTPGGPPIGPVQPPITGQPPEPGQPPTYARPQVQLRNLTRPTATDFRVGEKFTLQILGRPSSAVTVSSTHNGVGSPIVAQGSTDSAGDYSVTGVFTTAQKGEWYESWYVAGALATPVLHFFVS